MDLEDLIELFKKIGPDHSVIVHSARDDDDYDQILGVHGDLPLKFEGKTINYWYDHGPTGNFFRILFT